MNTGKQLKLQLWMVLLAAFWLVRFWLVRDETIWLLGLDVYRGEETVELVKVSLARDGLLHLFGALILFSSYASLLIRHRREQTKKKKDEESSNGVHGTR